MKFYVLGIITKARLVVSRSVKLKKYVKFFFSVFQRLFYITALLRNDRLHSNFEIVGMGSENFYGYYDKKAISDDRRFVITNVPNGQNLKICIADLDDLNVLKHVATSSAWSFQQGAMAEWVNGRNIIFNDFQDGNLVARVINTEDDQKNLSLENPVQCLSPTSDFYISLNYNLLTELRPEYGYHRNCQRLSALKEHEFGLQKCYFDNSSELIISLEELRFLNDLSPKTPAKINHVVISPCSSKILFMLRYFQLDQKISMLYLYDLETKKCKKLREGVVSHYCWVSPRQICVWLRSSKGEGQIEIINVCTEDVAIPDKVLKIPDGHPVSVDGQILIDNYPDLFSVQTLRLISPETLEITELCEMKVKALTSVAHRCDFHPRFDGEIISIDCMTKYGRRRL